MTLLLTFFRPKPKHHFGFHFPLSKKSENEEEMVDEAASPVGDIHEHGIDGRIDTIKGVPLVHFTGAPLAPVSFGAVVAVFLSLLFSAVALLCGKVLISILMFKFFVSVLGHCYCLQ